MKVEDAKQHGWGTRETVPELMRARRIAFVRVTHVVMARCVAKLSNKLPHKRVLNAHLPKLNILLYSLFLCVLFLRFPVKHTYFPLNSPSNFFLHIMEKRITAIGLCHQRKQF